MSAQTQQQDSPGWSYDERHQCGPQNWPSYFRAGALQSPINIQLRAHQDNSVTCCAGQLKESLHLNVRSDSRTSFTSSLESSGSSSSRSTPTRPNNSDCLDDDERDDGFDERRPASRNDNRKQRQQAQRTRLCATNRKVFLGYPRYLNNLELTNTGHGWQASLSPELSSHTLLAGPPLGDREYRLAQFHCHWGEDCDSGSEHQIDGKSYSAELHFVHWNCTDFKTPEQAGKHKHGLAVLAVLVQALEGEQNRNKHLEKITRGLKSIQEAGAAATVAQTRLDLKKLFPANRWQYATYEGSLTTPPLSEVVDWVVFLNPIQCSASQIEEFRKIRCPARGGSEPTRKNCRPVQPSNGRLISIWNHHHNQKL